MSSAAMIVFVVSISSYMVLEATKNMLPDDEIILFLEEQPNLSSHNQTSLLSKEETSLSTLNRAQRDFEMTQQDIDFQRDIPVPRRKPCQLKTLGYSWKKFELTQLDIDFIARENCIIAELDLCYTKCFPVSSRIDLSSLKSLRYLKLNHCTNKDFVITGLPPYLAYFEIRGFTERNVQLRNSFFTVQTLQYLVVSEPHMCCQKAMENMFGRYLNHVRCDHTNEEDNNLDNAHVVSNSSVNCSSFNPFDGSQLSIMRPEDRFVIGEMFAGTNECTLKILFVKTPNFWLTPADIDILSRCPLEHIFLGDSHCFSGPTVDLSVLKNLTSMGILLCRHSDFVITRLPAVMQHLDIRGLAEFNIRLEDDGSGFGEFLTMLHVNRGALCCNYTLQNMFSRDVSSVCGSTGFYGPLCGLYFDDGNYNSLQIDTREQLQNYTDQLRDGCNISEFGGVGREFYLTQHDIDVLAGCPTLKDISLPYTSCLSGQIDLSVLPALESLYIPNCATLDFSITGLPATLVKLDIRGLSVDNIRLEQTPESSQISIEQLEVSDPTMCSCPQAAVRMFGNNLSEATCRLTQSIYSASNKFCFVIADDFKSAISSCENLIDDLVLRVLLWSMALVATTGNLAVVVYRVVVDTQSLTTAYGVYPFNLALSDLLMGVYLLVIAVADRQFRGEYVLYDDEWRHGPICTFAGFVSTLSSETSAIFILLITVERVLAIQFPFGEFRLSRKINWILCCTTWVIGVLVSSVPLFLPDWELYSYNSICVGLPLNTDSYPGSGYAVAIYIGLNSVIFLMIAVGQVAIYRAMWANSADVKLGELQGKRRYKRDMAVAKQLSVIVMTDFLCWFPVCVMGLMVQAGGHLIPSSLYAWSAVVILPINSAINPLLYTLRRGLGQAVRRCRVMNDGGQRSHDTMSSTKSLTFTDNRGNSESSI